MTAAITAPKSAKNPRGFQTMTPERRREIASMGGRTAHQLGTAHKFTSEEGRAAAKRRVASK